MAQGQDLHDMACEEAKAFCYGKRWVALEVEGAAAVAAGPALADGECAAAAAALP